MYLPKSQIVQNQFTNGGMFSRSDNGEDYKGYYWEDSRGNIFTGKNPTDGPTISLNNTLEVSTEEAGPLNRESAWLTDYNPTVTEDKPGQIPARYIAKPTEEQYSTGEFQRYFTKKTNQNIYFEINEKDYTDLSSENRRLLWHLFEPISIPWQISGDKHSIAKTNRNIVYQTEQKQKLPGFSKIFKGQYLQYYK